MIELTGRFVQGGLVIGQTEAGANVTFEGRRLRVSPSGIFLIGFSRDAPETATLFIRYSDGSSVRKTLVIAGRTYEVQRIDGLATAMVTPPSEFLKRIKEENAHIRLVRNQDTPVTLFKSGWIWPARGRITGVYGSQRILNGEPRQPHYGVDISAPEGSTVVAPAAGIVALAEENMYFSGGTLILDHGHGLTSAYLHLRKLYVLAGENVIRGEPIGEIGATGRATGAHLDWRINLFDTRLDPSLLFSEPTQ